MKRFAKIKLLLLLGGVSVLSVGALHAYAQEEDLFLDATAEVTEISQDGISPPDENSLESIVQQQAVNDLLTEGAEVASAAPQKKRASEYLKLPSLLFTFGEQQAIIDARNAVPPILPNSINCEIVECAPEDIPEPPPPEARYIRLGGIVFKSNVDWTIWLNKQRITPAALPEEILDLKVFEEYIEMKWYDEYTKQILPIRIRPHQSFHMDQRIFLPG